MGKVHSVWWNLSPGKGLLSKRWADTVSLLRGALFPSSKAEASIQLTTGRSLSGVAPCHVLHGSREPALHTQMDCRREFLGF